MNIPFLLAPMAELSHRALRELIEGFAIYFNGYYCGCDEYFTEMISAGALVSRGLFEKWYTDTGPCPRKVVCQLTGHDAEQIALAAAVLDQGECAGIDLNMGCSAPTIVRTGAGVSWMASIDKAGALVQKVRKQVRRRLSVKLRIGFEDDFDYLVRFCRRLEEEGAEFITLHPRTAKEKFKRSCRWDYVESLSRILRIPVAGNGDIADAAALAQKASVKVGERPYGALMAGRAAVRCPWIFAQARMLEIRRREAPVNAGISTGRPPLTRIDLEETALRFLDLLSRYQPPEFHQSRARRFFNYFCENFTWAHFLRTRLNRETSPGRMAKVLQAYIQENPGEKFVNLEKNGGNFYSDRQGE
ncbi:MAG: tRNA-dihydrouridine synthase family protein [Treponema sp.]|jgi:tRNA-dihydrouridine synthase|nr:tRNA-dihydrouridine synthase family protein [Treponema sp.]